jgi:hypothetical protein
MFTQLSLPIKERGLAVATLRTERVRISPEATITTSTVFRSLISSSTQQSLTCWTRITIVTPPKTMYDVTM